MHKTTKKELADELIRKIWAGAENPPCAELLDEDAQRMAKGHKKAELEDILYGPRQQT